MLQIHSGNPLDMIDAGSEILRQSWQPPCLDYSPDYLRWQFSRPSSLPPVGILSLADGVAASCAMAVGHRVRVGGQLTEIYLASHMAARPGGPAGAALSVVRTEARQIAGLLQAFLTFAEAGSLGEAMLRGVDSVGMVRKHMGTIVVYMAAPRGQSTAHLVSTTEWKATVNHLPPCSVCLEPEFGEEELQHYLSHPWGRAFAIASDGNQITGAAMIGGTRSRSQEGTQQIATLYWAKALHGEALKALALLAAERFNSPFVSLANSSHLRPEILRAGGFRQLPTKFNAYLFTPKSQTALPAHSVGIEIT